MIVWFRIDGLPKRQFHSDARALAFLDPKVARHELLLDAGTLRASTGTENANVTLTLSNKAGQCSTLFAVPPLGAQATLFDDAVAQFSGTVTQIDLTATDCKITVQA